MDDKYKLGISCFGDFNPNVWQVQEFRTYHHVPRYITNLMGLRNRMAILSETFAHDRFYQRIRTNKAFLEEILSYTNQHAEQIRAITRQAEQNVLTKIRERAGKYENGIAYEMVPLDQPLALKAYRHTVVENAAGETEVVRGAEIVTLEGVRNYNQFQAVHSAVVPSAYVIPAGFTKVVDNLNNHGIAVETLAKAQTFRGQSFLINDRIRQPYPLNHHSNLRLQGEFFAGEKTFAPGDFLVSMETPLANLIFYLLEPESDDGLVFWNFFDDYFDTVQTREYPVFKVLP